MHAKCRCVEARLAPPWSRGGRRRRGEEVFVAPLKRIMPCRHVAIRTRPGEIPQVGSGRRALDTMRSANQRTTSRGGR